MLLWQQHKKKDYVGREKKRSLFSSPPHPGFSVASSAFLGPKKEQKLQKELNYFLHLFKTSVRAENRKREVKKKKLVKYYYCRSLEKKRKNKSEQQKDLPEADAQRQREKIRTLIARLMKLAFI